MADEEVVEEEVHEEAPPLPPDVDVSAPVVVEKPLPPPLYEVRPGLGQKFQAANVKEIILSTMREQLMSRQYRSDQVMRWCKSIANGVRQRVQDLEMNRYKIVVQTIILEMKGAGVKCGQRCIWDPETDAYVGDIFKNDTIFCYTVAYGVYMY